MGAWTERIAQLSPAAIVLFLGFLTLLRAACVSSRWAALRYLGQLLEPVIIAIGLVFLLLRPFVVQSYFIPSGSMRPTLRENDHILVNKLVYRVRPPRYGEVIVFRAPPAVDVGEKDYIKRVVGLPGDVIEAHAGFVTVGDGARKTIFYSADIRGALGEPLAADQIIDGADENLPPIHLTVSDVWLGDRRIPPAEFARRAGRPGETVTITPGLLLRNGDVISEGYVSEDVRYHHPAELVPPGACFVLGDNRNHSIDSHNWGSLPLNRVVGRAEGVFWPLSRLRRVGCEGN